MNNIKLIMTGKVVEIGDLECLEGQPDDQRSGAVLLIDRAQLKAGRNMFGETVGIFLAEDYPGWRVTEPPKDGSYIIAKGRIIAEDEFGCSITPYLGEIRWQKCDSGFEGWVYGGTQPLSVTCAPDERFVIDWWIKPPEPRGNLDANGAN